MKHGSAPPNQDKTYSYVQITSMYERVVEYLESFLKAYTPALHPRDAMGRWTHSAATRGQTRQSHLQQFRLFDKTMRKAPAFGYRNTQRPARDGRIPPRSYIIEAALNSHFSIRETLMHLAEYAYDLQMKRFLRQGPNPVIPRWAVGTPAENMIRVPGSTRETVNWITNLDTIGAAIRAAPGLDRATAIEIITDHWLDVNNIPRP